MGKKHDHRKSEERFYLRFGSSTTLTINNKKMSRIGKKPIGIPQGTKVAYNGNELGTRMSTRVTWPGIFPKSPIVVQ